LKSDDVDRVTLTISAVLNRSKPQLKKKTALSLSYIPNSSKKREYKGHEEMNDSKKPQHKTAARNGRNEEEKGTAARKGTINSTKK